MKSVVFQTLLVACLQSVARSMQYHAVSHQLQSVRQPSPGTEEAAAMVDWKLCDAEVHSNLGGQGPDAGAEEMRYSNIADLNGGGIDLVVTNTTPYEYKSAKQNGLKGCFGKFNLIAPSSVTLSFRFVRTGTNDDVDASNYLFSIYDVDESQQGIKEQLTFSTPVDGYWLTADTELIVSGSAAAGDLGFESSVVGVGSDNPEYPEELDPSQEARTVTVQYASVSEFLVYFAAVDSADAAKLSGRNFLFAGKSDLVEDAELTCTTADCEVWADPHVSGFDNSNPGPISLFENRMKTFDRQPVDVNVYERGDFWLVKNDRIHIQGRYQPSAEFGKDKSAIGAIAIGGAFIDNKRLIIEPKNGKVTYNGEVVAENSEFTRGFVNIKTYFDAVQEDGSAPASVDIDLPSQVRLRIKRYKTHLDAKITVPKMTGPVDGQCGNFNGDATDDTVEHVKGRMNWSVSATDLLFSSK